MVCASLCALRFRHHRPWSISSRKSKPTWVRADTIAANRGKLLIGALVLVVALGYFGFGGNMETAITIRTIIMKDGVASVQAGGGIVYDSKPEAEFEETVNKAMGMFIALDLAEERSGAQRVGSLGY